MTLTTRNWKLTNQLTFRIHPTLTERLDQLAAERLMSRAAYIRQLVEQGVAAASKEVA